VYKRLVARRWLKCLQPRIGKPGKSVSLLSSCNKIISVVPAFSTAVAESKFLDKGLFVPIMTVLSDFPLAFDLFASRHRGRLCIRHGRVLYSLQSEFVRDSAFPFSVGEELIARIEGTEIVIEKVRR
jgi:hypothetical protein